MPGRLSGVDAISPAVERTKAQLFVPFRFRHWARLAVVCLLTGEITGGGGGWGGMNFNFPPPKTSSPESGFTSLLGPPFKQFPELLAWVVVAVLAAILFVLVMLYVSSVFRFILFDAVLHNRCELKEGWHRWQRQGSSYFLWQIGFGMVSLAGLALVVGGPIFFAWRAGIFRNPDQHFALLILGGVLIFCVFVAALILVAIALLFAKDFVVPVMALEDKGVLDGWRQVFSLLGQEKGAYTIYVLMKIVLAIGSALLFGIIDFFVVLAFFIPVGALGVAAYFLAKGSGLGWTPVTISVVVVAAAAALSLLFLIISVVSVPAMVFFQSYALLFFGSRYAALGQALASPQTPPAILPGTLAPVPIT